MNKIRVSVPDGVSFNDLRLVRQPDGTLSFDRDVLAAVCVHSGATAGSLDQRALCMVLIEWYLLHIQSGGEKCQVMSDLVQEARWEAQLGTFVHEPGHA